MLFRSGRILLDECLELSSRYTERAISKFHTMARNHRKRYNRPLGLLHCSVVDSDDLEAFAQLGNAFGKSFGGQTLSFRDFGSYEMAPPPEHIWADDLGEDDNDQKRSVGSVIMPWYDTFFVAISPLFV